MSGPCSVAKDAKQLLPEVRYDLSRVVFESTEFAVRVGIINAKEADQLRNQCDVQAAYQTATRLHSVAEWITKSAGEGFALARKTDPTISKEDFLRHNIEPYLKLLRTAPLEQRCSAAETFVNVELLTQK
jgi:hypothetical protein